MNLAINSDFSRVEESALEIALSHARGSFQRGLIMGYERLSLASLKGKAKKYSGHYAESREEIGKHNRRELFIGVSK